MSTQLGGTERLSIEPLGSLIDARHLPAIQMDQPTA